MEITAAYRPRSTKFLGVQSLSGWKIKAYGISVKGPMPDQAARAAAAETVREAIGEMDGAYPHYRTGFSILHEARDAYYLIFAWWVGENMIRSRMFRADLGRPKFTGIDDSGLMACVWEMKVIAFESRAWAKEVLARAGKVDVRGYLARSLGGSVRSPRRAALAA